MMTFDSSFRENTFKLSMFKSRLLKEVKEKMKNIQEILYDEYDIESIYIGESFYKDDLKEDALIIFKINRKIFESMLEKDQLKKINNINYLVEVEDCKYFLDYKEETRWVQTKCGEKYDKVL